jgi:hypothetical protein
MLQSVPPGGDAYLIKRVVMDKTDADAVIVLRNCLTAMNAAGRILVVDPMLPANAEPHPNCLTDMLMLVVTRRVRWPTWPSTSGRISGIAFHLF